MDIDYQSDYLTKHLLTYIGNKRKLLPFIGGVVQELCHSLGKEKPSMFDGFSGTGCVARLFKHFASTLYVNDIEDYSTIINQCYLANRSQIVEQDIYDTIEYLNKEKLLPRKEIGFIEKHYAPKDDNEIQEGERVFYTNRNAKIIDNIRRDIDWIELPHLKPYLLATLLVKASIHTNTSGVFKGFHKKNGIGHFGGAGENALNRIKADIVLDYPIFSDVECEVDVRQGDINKIIRDMPEVDIAYYDPPYNQHPYGSNYFMLNIIANYDAPAIQEGVSGISKDWNRSAYNKRQEAAVSLESLIRDTKAKYILISYNNEGIIPERDFVAILEKFGQVELKKQEYNTYRGSRNLRNRSNKVTEQLWILRVC